MRKKACRLGWALWCVCVIGVTGSGVSAVIAAQAGAPAPASSAAAVKMRIAVAAMPADMGTQTVERFGKLTELLSHGRIQFEFFPGGKLGKAEETMAMTQKGAIEGYCQSASYLTKMLPYAEALEMPLAFPTPLDAWVALDGALGETIKREAAKFNYFICGFVDYGGRDFITASRPIVKAEDLKGMKLRCMASAPIQVKMYQAWGAKPTPTDPNEVYQALQAGQIDGLDFPAPSVVARKFNEVSKYVSLANLYRVSNPLALNKGWFDSLPKDLQEIVIGAARQAIDWGRMSQERERMAAVADLRKRGMNVNAVAPAEIGKLREMLKPLYDEARKQHPKEMMDLILGSE